MKTIFTSVFSILTFFNMVYSQDEKQTLIGLRINPSETYDIIYADKNGTPDLNDSRRINSEVYYRIINVPQKTMPDGVTYQMITIPSGKKTNLSQDSANLRKTEVSRDKESVNSSDFDKDFWIDKAVLDKSSPEYRNDKTKELFTGVLTAPFKYRPKLGSAPESILEGEFNIATFIGYRIPIRKMSDYYFVPFGFAGITTLNYNSANNSRITTNTQETGAGISYGLGFSLRMGNISPGVVFGWDKGTGNLGGGFLYSDKMWISFSLNYDFFKVDPNPSKLGQKKKVI